MVTITIICLLKIFSILTFSLDLLLFFCSHNHFCHFFFLILYNIYLYIYLPKFRGFVLTTRSSRGCTLSHAVCLCRHMCMPFLRFCLLRVGHLIIITALISTYFFRRKCVITKKDQRSQLEHDMSVENSIMNNVRLHHECV